MRKLKTAKRGNGLTAVRKLKPAKHKLPKATKMDALKGLPKPADAAPYNVRLFCNFPTVIVFTLDAKDAEEAQETAKYLAQRWCKVAKVEKGEETNLAVQLVKIGEPYPKFAASIVSQCQNAKILDVRSDRFPQPKNTARENLNRRGNRK
jgi:hypothetical protein